MGIFQPAIYVSLPKRLTVERLTSSWFHYSIGTFKSEKKHPAFSQQSSEFWRHHFDCIWILGDSMDILWYSHHSHKQSFLKICSDRWDARVLKKITNHWQSRIESLDHWTRARRIGQKWHSRNIYTSFPPSTCDTQKEQWTVEGRAPTHFQSHVNDIMRIGLVDT